MRCPVCKAENAQGPQCRRCKADLSLLFALAEQQRRTLTEARQCLARGEGRQATQLAETADWLRGDAEAKQVAALGHLLAGNFAAAWRCYWDWWNTPGGRGT